MDHKKFAEKIANYELLRSLMFAKGYKWFEDEMDLNYMAFRNPAHTPDTFDDVFVLAWKENGSPCVRTWIGTTDPGGFYLEKPLNPKGTAIVIEGQHRKCLTWGHHKGQYLALIACRPVIVVRDNNRDAKPEPDFPNQTAENPIDRISKVVLDLTVFDRERYKTANLYMAEGINHHRAELHGKTPRIGKNSAGCQVAEDVNNYGQNLKIFTRYFEKYTHLSYTLMNFNDVDKPQQAHEPSGNKRKNVGSSE